MKDTSYSLDRLFDLVARLRAPDGCPWDQEQTIEDLRAYLVEEAHEVAAAIDSGDWEEIRTELGDLLFQVVFVAHLAAEGSAFAFSEVIDRIEEKMITRHPHVFGDEELADSAAVHRAWEKRKIEGADAQSSLLAGVPTSLPSLLAAYRMTQKAAGVGFDWPDAQAVLQKVEEEIDELRQELSRSSDPKRDPKVHSELGDLMFTLANLARHLDLDPEAVLATANAKFLRRFQTMESALAQQNRSLSELDLQEMESAWQIVKRAEGD